MPRTGSESVTFAVEESGKGLAQHLLFAIKAEIHTVTGSFGIGVGVVDRIDRLYQFLGERNVNGTEIASGARVSLRDGDRVHIGAWTVITIHAA